MKNYVYQVPTFVDLVADNERLAQSCLILSLIYGLEHLKSLMDHSSNFSTLLKLGLPDEKSKKSGYKCLLKKYDALVSAYNIEETGPHNLSDILHFCQKKKVQVHLIEYANGKVRYKDSVPQKYTPQYAQLYFLESYPNKGIRHVNLIKRPVTLFKQKRFVCLVCKSDWLGKSGYRHACKVKGAQCAMCRRELKREDYNVHPNMYELYCDRLLSETNIQECDGCNLVAVTSDCLKNHKKHVCARVYKCKMCGTVAQLGGENAKTDWIDSHICGLVKCGLCRCQVSPYEVHDCEMKLPRSQTHHPNIGSLSFAYRKEVSGGSKATSVTTTTLIPNFATLVFEGDNTNFHSICFSEWREDHELEKDVDDRVKPCHLEEIEEVKTAPKISDEPVPQLVIVNDNDVAYQLLDYILNQNSKCWNTSYLVQDKDLTVLLSASTNFVCQPQLIPKGKGLLALHIPEREVTFLTVTSYWDYTQYDILLNRQQRFKEPHLEISEEEAIKMPLFFPVSFNDPINYNHEGLTPFVDNYIEPSDSKDLQKKKREFHSCYSYEYEWIFKDEIKSFHRNLAMGLVLVGLDTIRFHFMIESKLKQNKRIDRNNPRHKELPYVHPLAFSNPTIATSMFALYRLYCIKEGNLRTCRYEYTGIPKNHQSNGEHQWLSFVKETVHDLQTCNFKGGMPLFRGKVMPDGYSSLLRCFYWFQGCRIHGHIDCPLNDGIPEDKELDFPRGKTLAQLNLETAENIREFMMLNKKFGNKNVIMYECEWIKMGKTDPNVKAFMAYDFEKITMPTHRLIPRDVLKGGFDETLEFTWDEVSNPQEELRYIDCRSLYPHVARTSYFPIGAPERITGAKLREGIEWNDHEVTWHGTHLIGMAQVTVYPPDHLPPPELPILSIRIDTVIDFHADTKTEEKSYKRVYGLCRTCAEKQSLKPCRHQRKKRSWTDTYCIAELELAHQLGYRFLFHECHHYTAQAPIFFEFLTVLCAERLKAQGFPDGIIEEQKEAYCFQMNTKMVIPDEYQIRKEDMEESFPERAKFIKKAMNSFLGKFAQGMNMKHDLVKTSAEITKIWNKPKADIVDFELVNSNTGLVIWTDASNKSTANLSNNCLIFGMICAFGRIYMYNVISELLQSHKDVSIKTIKTDAVVYSCPKGLQLCDHLLGPCIGQFKDEHTDIKSFVSLGTKNYGILKKKGDRCEWINKISGLSFTNECSKVLDASAYNQLVMDFLQNNLSEVQVPQVRATVSGSFNKLNHTVTMVRNSIFQKRAVLREQGEKYVLTTRPYGFKSEEDIQDKEPE